MIQFIIAIFFVNYIIIYKHSNTISMKEGLTPDQAFKIAIPMAIYEECLL